MEKDSDYSEQMHAAAIAEQAKVLLEHPESVLLLQRYTTQLGPEQRLEVRISGHTGETELDRLADNLPACT